MNQVVGIDVENDIDDPIAMGMIRDLVKAYPGHAWFVVIRGGIVHVKDLDISPAWGMCLHYSDIKSDASDRTRKLLRAAGEFLERANLKRGANTGQVVKHVDGIEDKYLTRR